LDKIMEYIVDQKEQLGAPTVPYDYVVQYAIRELGFEHSKIIHDLDTMMIQGKLYSPKGDKQAIGIP